jgi:hypothetical protein
MFLNVVLEMQALEEITGQNNSGRNNQSIIRALNGQTLDNVKSFLRLLESIQVIADAKVTVLERYLKTWQVLNF